MKFGYARVSTRDKGQTVEKWRQLFLNAGIEPENIIEEYVSGGKSWKTRKLADLVAMANEGDEIITPELTRLGRSTEDVLSLVRVLKEKGVTVITEKEGYKIGAAMRASDTAMLTVMSAMGQWERDIASERIKEGIGHYRQKNPGKGWGRPPGKNKTGGSKASPEKIKKMRRLLAQGNTKASVARELGVSRRTIYNWIEESKSKDVQVPKCDIEEKGQIRFDGSIAK